jgi:hypothetical protein
MVFDGGVLGIYVSPGILKNTKKKNRTMDKSPETSVILLPYIFKCKFNSTRISLKECRR